MIIPSRENGPCIKFTQEILYLTDTIFA